MTFGTEPPPQPETVPEPPPDTIPPTRPWGTEWEARCRKPLVDREFVGRRLWTADLCANTVFNLVKRPVAHYPTGVPAPRRRWEFRTVRPIRARGSNLPGYGGEVCAYHYGRLVKFPDNRWRVVFCTRPADQSQSRFSVGQFFVEPRERTTGDATGIKPGRAAAMAGYAAPMWTELIIHSQLRLCGAVEH
jgi:hypothetical protein